MTESLIISFDDLPLEIRKRIVYLEGGSEEARAWMLVGNVYFGGQTPAEHLATAKNRGAFLERTCNCYVREHLEAYREGQTTQEFVPDHNHKLPEGRTPDRDLGVPECPACAHYYRQEHHREARRELNIPPSAGWSREQSGRDQARRVRAELDRP